MSKLVVIVLGKRNAGKSHTWNELFFRTVRTGTEIRNFELRDGRQLPVFVMSGSPQERRVSVEDVINDEAKVVFCSLQYVEEARASIKYFADNGFEMYVHWLNPGFNDEVVYPDSLGILNYLLHLGATIGLRDGTADSRKRVSEIRDFLAGWVSHRRVGVRDAS